MGSLVQYSKWMLTFLERKMHSSKFIMIQTMISGQEPAPCILLSQYRRIPFDAFYSKMQYQRANEELIGDYMKIWMIVSFKKYFFKSLLVLVGVQGLQHQLWRLRLNWIYFIVIASLYAISYTSISSSFHQFVTNPTYKELNYSENADKIEPGLGQSELFYSWVIALFNIGALFGAVGSGLLIKYIPYWYLILLTLSAHTIGYVLYAVSNKGWIIMLSKVLSGVFIGGEMTLALSYFAESSIEYERIKKKLGETVKSSSVRRKLFAWHNVGVGIGYIIGPGAAAVLSLFDVDQFRSIAWFNVAFGILFVMLEIVMFHGESTFKNIRSKCQNWNFSAYGVRKDPLESFILFSLIMCRGVLSFRFGVYETIYNPVLGDYFGFDERYASYFFFALVVSQISGTVLLLFLQHFKLDSRIIAIIGLALSILSCALLADWQAVSYDKCTEFSLYHHRQLHMENGSGMLLSRPYYATESYLNLESTLMTCEKEKNNHYSCTQGCYMAKFSPGSSFDVHKYHCETILTLEHIDNYVCNWNTNTSVCMFVNSSSYSYQGMATPSVDASTRYKYNDFQSQCTASVINGDYCHWAPNSLITKQYCSECQPICRSLSHSLNFVQFCLGAAILMISIPIAWVPVASIVSEKTAPEMQGVVMGVVVALTAIGRTVSPLWLDAAYEGMMKRTFLAMIIMILAHLPFLLFFLCMYPKLGHQPKNSDLDDRVSSSDESDAM